QHQHHRHPHQPRPPGEDEEAAKSFPQGQLREGEQPDYDTFLSFLLLPPPPATAAAPAALPSRSPPPDPDEKEAAAFKLRKMNSEKLANYAPTHFKFSPDDAYLTYLHAASHQMTRQLWGVDLRQGSSLEPRQVLSPPSNGGDTEDNLSLDEKLRRERQRAYATGITTYAWGKGGKILVPLQGSLYVQDGVHGPLRRVYDAEGGSGSNSNTEEMGLRDAQGRRAGDEEGMEEEEEEGGGGERREEEGEAATTAFASLTKQGGGAIDPHISPDGKWIAFVRAGEVCVVPIEEVYSPPPSPAAY
ncbi:hypothetical protein VYU27_010383, partial [Nannochloropsis oceanica]